MRKTHARTLLEHFMILVREVLMHIAGGYILIELACFAAEEDME